MNPQCMMEVRDRDRLLDENGTPTDFCFSFTQWERCSNDGLIILRMKGGKNFTVCYRCLLTITNGQYPERTGNYQVFRSTQYGGKP